MPTRRGWTLVVIAGGMALAGGLFGIQELYALAAASVALVLGCTVWVNARVWSIDASRRVRPQRVPAGGSARAELTIHNTGTRRSPVLSLRDPFGDGSRWAGYLLAPLEPGEQTRAAYQLPTDRRGLFPLGPLSMELSDPFGLARVQRLGAGSDQLMVHPPVQVVSPPGRGAGTDRQHSTGSPMLGVQGEEFFAIREYRNGDDLRRVHWTSTARLDELMIRQDQTAWRGRLTVVVDLRRDLYTDDALEAALSAAASVAASGIRAQSQVRLVTTAAVDTGYGSSTAHESRILDELAAAHAHTGGTLTGLVSPVEPGRAGTVVVVTSSGSSDADLMAAARLGASGSATVVIVDRGRGTQPAGISAPRLPATVVVVGAG
ncbi:MAG: DUF58 domain-containing protein, partial [Acidimicrobiaceae bacterium]|nr:DUF58 domain-containing protein [Acidimicrobiaceae bacterium]